MSPGRTIQPLDRHTEIGELCERVRRATRRIVLPLAAVCSAEILYLFSTGQAGVGALALMSASTCIALSIWSNSAIGLPLLPFMVAQNLIVYGLPIVAHHENLTEYPASFVFDAGVEVMVLNISMVVGWAVAMKMFRPSPPTSFVLNEYNGSGTAAWLRLGFSMIGLATAFEFASGFSFMGAFYAMLPSGADSILNALVSVASACGFFLVSMVIGGGKASPTQKAAFWALLTANTMISASGLLLASAAANLITVAIGLFWSSGRIPWRYVTIAMLVLSFLNIGKTTMRSRYWENEDTPGVDVTIGTLPSLYTQWASASYNAILENSDETQGQGDAQAKPAKNQTLLDRIDNLQNVLFAMDAIRSDHITILHGETYALIPPLLVPRIFWPNKPHSHEGQILLNVHFRRQDLNSTVKTYIAWGLLAEAYGNFGPIVGALCLGLFLGAAFAWVENLTARKLIVSMEGFLSLCLMISLMNSFEMVASVLVTSTFQSMAVIVVASLPFVARRPNSSSPA